jgi:ribose transport system permease protein
LRNNVWTCDAWPGKQDEICTGAERLSLRGGEGSILGAVLGTILLQVLQNLVNLLGIPSSLNFAVMGSVILQGALADQQFNQLPPARPRRRPRNPASARRGSAAARGSG